MSNETICTHLKLELKIFQGGKNHTNSSNGNRIFVYWKTNKTAVVQKDWTESLFSHSTQAITTLRVTRLSLANASCQTDSRPRGARGARQSFFSCHRMKKRFKTYNYKKITAFHKQSEREKLENCVCLFVNKTNQNVDRRSLTQKWKKVNFSNQIIDSFRLKLCNEATRCRPCLLTDSHHRGVEIETFSSARAAVA